MPEALSPQQRTKPSVSTTHVVARPLATYLTSPPTSTLPTGANRSVGSPYPRAPDCPSPQQVTAPLSSTAQLFAPPAVTNVARSPSSTAVRGAVPSGLAWPRPSCPE